MEGSNVFHKRGARGGHLTACGKLRPQPTSRTFPHALENATRFPQRPADDDG